MEASRVVEARSADAATKIRSLADDGRLPAVAAAVVAEGQLIFSAAAGSAAGVPCSVDETMFLTASISKTFTAIACLQACERGELDIDADCGQYVSQPVRSPHFKGTKLTVRHLLQHRSGLCDDESALLPGRWRTEHADCETSLDTYVRSRLLPGGDAFTPRLWSAAAPPGAASYHYSNAGFALAGWVLEAATGRPLWQLAEERIFAPLGMTRSAFTLAEARAPGTLAAPTPPGHHYGVAEYPAAALRSTAGDLAKYLLALTAEACPLLRPASRAQLLPESFRGGLAWWGRDATYGERDSRSQVWSHGGFMQGVRTHVHLWPLKRAALVVLTNGEDERANQGRRRGRAAAGDPGGHGPSAALTGRRGTPPPRHPERPCWKIVFGCFKKSRDGPTILPSEPGGARDGLNTRRGAQHWDGVRQRRRGGAEGAEGAKEQEGRVQRRRAAAEAEGAHR